MAFAQKQGAQSAAKTAEELVGETFDRFADRTRSEYRDELRDLLGNRQLGQQLTGGWNQYCQGRGIQQPTLDDLDAFMSLKGSGIIESFISSEENRDDFALLLSFKGDMAYSLTRGKIVLTEYGSEAGLENYLSEVKALTEDAVSAGLGTYRDEHGNLREAAIATFELPTIEQATMNKIAELFNGSIGYTSDVQTTVSGLPRGRLPVFFDAESGIVAWNASVPVSQSL